MDFHFKFTVHFLLANCSIFNYFIWTFVLQTQAFENIKKNFAKENSLAIEGLKFYFDGDQVENDDTPESLGMEEDDCIDVFVL